MSRPTMSRVLYTQQLGRGMRLAEGKESLMVFDFVDNAGLPVEKPNSVYCHEDATDSEIQRNILSNPFRRFEDMQMMRHTKTLGIIEVDPKVWKSLTEQEKREIRKVCEEKLEGYYAKRGI